MSILERFFQKQIVTNTEPEKPKDSVVERLAREILEDPRIRPSLEDVKEELVNDESSSLKRGIKLRWREGSGDQYEAWITQLRGKNTTSTWDRVVVDIYRRVTEETEPGSNKWVSRAKQIFATSAPESDSNSTESLGVKVLLRALKTIRKPQGVSVPERSSNPDILPNFGCRVVRAEEINTRDREQELQVFTILKPEIDADRLPNHFVYFNSQNFSRE